MANDLFLSKLEAGRVSLMKAGEAFADARFDDLLEETYKDYGKDQRREASTFRHGVGVRIVRGVNTSFVSREGDFDWNEAISTAQQAVRSCGNESCDDRTPEQRPATRAWNLVSMETRGNHAEQYKELRAMAFDVSGSVAEVLCQTRSTVGWRGIIDSDGTSIIKPIQDVFASVTIYIKCVGGGRTAITLSVGSDSHLHVIDGLKESILGATEKIVLLMTARPLKQSLQCPLVLSPASAGFLVHEAFGHLCEADRFPRASLPGRDLDLSVASEELTISDRGDLSPAPGCSEYDDEGVAVVPAILVNRGRWTGLLHSRETARQCGANPTGNARTTSFRFAPVCRMRLTEICPGSDDPASIIEGIRDGLYVDDPAGGHVRGGRFVVPIGFARRIRDGRLAEPVSGIVIQGIPLRVLRDIRAIGRDSQLVRSSPGCSRGKQTHLPVSMAAPTIRVDNLDVHSS